MKNVLLGTALLSTLILVTAPSIVISTALEDGAPFDPRNVRWTRLELKAKKLVFSARSDVVLRTVAVTQAAAEWIESPHGRVVGATGSDVLEVTIESTGFGASTNRVWFNPGRADALQRVKLKPQGYRKAARFSDEGIFVLRTAPVDKAEAKGPFSEWSKVEEFFYPRPDDTDCHGISEPSVLFYMLSARAADEPLQVCVFSNKQVVPLSIEIVGTERLDVNYEESRDAAATRRRGKVDAQRIAVRPLESGGDFELMGLEGAVEFLLEKESRVPLEVRGKISNLGGVRIKLAAVDLAG